jgi:rhodanese-related sulfurtransferase
VKRLRFLTVLGLTICAATVIAAQEISVDSPNYGVSIPSAGVVVRHSFRVWNKGDRPLTISDVQPSCVCTKAVPTKAELAPGQSTEVDVTVDTTGFAGQVVRTVTLVSNDPANPQLVLVISVTNIQAKESKPAAISVSDFQKRFYLLVDVRTPEEFASGHLLGAVNVPLSELQNNLAAWVPRLPRDVPVVLQCRSGARSTQAAQILIRAGFANVLNLDGGILDWTNTFGSRYLFAF